MNRSTRKPKSKIVPKYIDRYLEEKNSAWVRFVKSRVLLVDDDLELLDVTRLLMQQTDANIEIVVAESVQDALQKLEKEQYDVVISDYLMSDSSGLDLLEALRSSGDDVGFIVWTGHSSEDVAIKALNLGADYYIQKGTDTKEQFKLIQSTIAKLVTRKEAGQSQDIPQKVVGEFIHRLSHDVVGILQNIMGYTTLLTEEFDKSYLEGIARLTNKLSARMKKAVSDVDSGELAKKT